MNYAIVIDSIAAVPNFILKKRPFKVMPVTVKVDGVEMPDTFDEKSLVDIYKGNTLNVKSQVDTAPPTEQQIRDLISEQVAPYYDFALCQTVTKKVSPTYDNFQFASNSIAKDAREVRNSLGIEHAFRMTCLNTGSTLAGQGLVAIYADMLLTKGATFSEYTSLIEKFARVVHCYPVVADPLYSRARALEKGVKTVSFPAALIGKSVGLNPIIQIRYDHITKTVLTKRGLATSINHLLLYACERIEEGLYAPVVNLSYAGDKRDLDGFQNYARLLEVARVNNVKVLVGVMSLAASVVYGPGAFALGIAPKNQTAVPV